MTGAHYASLRVTTQPALSPGQAVVSASAQSLPSVDGPGAPSVAMNRSAQLRVDPQTGRQFYRITSAAPGDVTYQDVDADSGAVLQTWTGIDGCTVGHRRQDGHQDAWRRLVDRCGQCPDIRQKLRWLEDGQR